MKLIFLDIDGVLNSEDWCDFLINECGHEHGYGGFFNQVDDPTIENVKWDPATIQRLVRIVDATGAKLVISSTWRVNFALNKFHEMFALYGAKFDIVGKTIDMGANNVYEPYSHNSRYSSGQGFRGNEIDAYLEYMQETEEDVESYVILDDGTDFHVDQQPFFVNTDEQVGLTDSDVIKAIRILNDFKVL